MVCDAAVRSASNAEIAAGGGLDVEEKQLLELGLFVHVELPFLLLFVLHGEIARSVMSRRGYAAASLFERREPRSLTRCVKRCAAFSIAHTSRRTVSAASLNCSAVAGAWHVRASSCKTSPVLRKRSMRSGKLGFL